MAEWKHKKICVYCASSADVREEYFAATRELGRLIGQGQNTLIFGGCNVGLMGAIAKATHDNGGHVIGIIPDAMHQRGLAYECDEVAVTPNMHERKAAMEDRADAFIALPGGFGTLEEVTQVITLKMLQYHDKPIIFINTLGYYDEFLLFLEHCYTEKFARPIYRELYHVSPTPQDAFDYLARYVPPQMEREWLTKQG
jgi:uncharacterized protein (TIGR00730 family)